MAFCHPVFAYRGRHSLTGGRPRADLARLEDAIGHKFSDRDLIAEALTHSSATSRIRSYERLEFLGDAVLQLFSTEILFSRFPGEREGTLHSYRTQLVSTAHLATIARAWGLGEQAKLGKGEEATGGRNKDRLLAGLFEAVLGAIYLDGGYTAAQETVQQALKADLDALPSLADPRATLHEWCQREHGSPPEYKVVLEEGPPHDRTFGIVAMVRGEVIGEGSGRSKKAASVEAARAATATLGLCK